MDENQRKEQFSIAYVRAVAAVAGYSVDEKKVDDDSVDGTLSARGLRGTTRSPRLDVQLKCTARDVRSEQEARYPLPVKNYDELRCDDYMVPRILIVVVVPPEMDRWLDHSEEQLAMRHCGYWLSLRGLPETTNEHTVTVSLPRTQQFTVEALTAIMGRIGSGGLP